MTISAAPLARSSVYAAMTAVAYHLPERVVSNAELSAAHPAWKLDRIAARVGIHARHRAAPGECTSDLAVAAAEKLFAAGGATRDEIDFIVLCTQTPDHFLPTTACLVQDRLGIPCTAGAFDMNLGCSGYTYALAMAKGLVESGQARAVLLLHADVYSHIADHDRALALLFGDGAAATIVRAVDEPSPHGAWIGASVFGTDGRGAPNLQVERGGFRSPASATEPPRLSMDGAEIFGFALREVPLAIQRLLARDGSTIESFAHVILHQANGQLLEALRVELGVPKETFAIELADVANTVSATIPIALARRIERGQVKSGDRMLLAGFGVGYSWSALGAVWHG